MLNFSYQGITKNEILEEIQNEVVGVMSSLQEDNTRSDRTYLTKLIEDYKKVLKMEG